MSDPAFVRILTYTYNVTNISVMNCMLCPNFSRYFTGSGDGLEGRSELLGCLKGGAYSQNHVGLSKELALANPELTLPMFCGKEWRMLFIYDAHSVYIWLYIWCSGVQVTFYFGVLLHHSFSAFIFRHSFGWSIAVLRHLL